MKHRIAQLKLLIASNNPGKVREYASLLGDFPVVLVTPAQEGLDIHVAEDGETFLENALQKAQAYCEASGLPTLADDSGLEVDALGGAPGIHSARYAGDSASDSDRYHQLLRALEDVPPQRRSARFRCLIALVLPDGRYETGEGKCEGEIAYGPRGQGGFGYDPVFYLPALEKTMAELPGHLKDRLSHRGRAVLRIKPALRRLLPHRPHK